MGPLDGIELLAVGLVLEQFQPALRDAQRVPKVVTDNTSELVEALVLAREFLLTLAKECFPVDALECRRERRQKDFGQALVRLVEGVRLGGRDDEHALILDWVDYRASRRCVPGQSLVLVCIVDNSNLPRLERVPDHSTG